MTVKVKTNGSSIEDLYAVTKLALRKLPGINKIQTLALFGYVYVNFDEKQVKENKIVNTLESSGYVIDKEPIVVSY